MNTTPRPDGAHENQTLPLPGASGAAPEAGAEAVEPTAALPASGPVAPADETAETAVLAADETAADEPAAEAAATSDASAPGAAGADGPVAAGAAEPIVPPAVPKADKAAERTWRKGYPGIFGIFNVIASGVLAVVWAWVPVSLLVAGVSGLFALGIGLLALFLWFLLQRAVNRFERYRAEAIYGDEITSLPTPQSSYPFGFGRFMHTQWLILKTPSFWRSTAHHYIKMLYGGFIGVLVAIGAGFCFVFGAAAINPVITAFVGPEIVGLGSRLGSGLAALAALVSTIVILFFSPYLDRILDRTLLPPTRTEALRAEVDSLDRARVGAVDAATTERLRIERDLHDGVQPMLVATSMKLGMAKAKIDSDPEAAKKLLTEAHAESKASINELRQLARGIHPAVLTDRGLDAAVSALAARCAVPVRVDIDLSERPAVPAQPGAVPGAAPGAMQLPQPARLSSETEAVAYFVVAEALTNISKHAQATEARVGIYVQDGRLNLSVSDNGRGGARIDPTIGTGLSGLADRVTAARGTWALTSPVGGPTTLVVEVPCE